MSKQNELAHYLSTRLCHDITGPIGAINNGLELLEESPEMREEAMEMIASSAREAAARLQFYRLAYGSVAEGGAVLLDDKRQIAERFFAATRTRLIWDDEAGSPVSFAVLRVVFNLLIIAAQALIRGGELTLTHRSGSVSVQAKGAVIKADVDVLNVLNSTSVPDAHDPKMAQIVLTWLSSRDAGASLAASAEPDAPLSLQLLY